MKISGLYVYPVKSARGVSVTDCQLLPSGLEHDRRFMVVDEEGTFLTQRDHPTLATLGATITGSELVLAVPGVEPVRVDLVCDGPIAEVTVWGDAVRGIDCGPKAAGLLTHMLARLARLVRMPRGAERRVDPDHASPGDVVSFADGFPVLISTEASIQAVNAGLERPVDVRRYRPNIVIEGAPAFAEDTWRSITIGEARLDLVKPCARCVVVDVDPDRGARAPGVLVALGETRKRGSKVLFGQNAIPRSLARLRVGDPVEAE